MRLEFINCPQGNRSGIERLEYSGADPEAFGNAVAIYSERLAVSGRARDGVRAEE